MKHLLVVSIIIIALYLFPHPTSARVIHPQQQQPPVVNIKKQYLNDLQGMREFIDEYVAEKMNSEQVPGLAVVVVKDGEIYFQKGYGYANIESKKPVVSSRTLFRVASISKLFTTIAVMQLVEQDKIDLNKPVNYYIKDFQLDNKYSQPISVASLLTHTSGLDVNDIGMSARTQEELQPLGKHLAKRKPQQILPPGTITTYSNYGMALAGYIVERVSGVPFAEYIDKNILQPLGMQHSSFVQPPPFSLRSDLAVGYEYDDNKFIPQPYTYEHQVPAIALSTTATDIANFMIAQLNVPVQRGRLGKTQILKAETLEEMQRQHFTNDARIPGIAYAFQEQFRNNLRIIRHGGLIEGFVSQLVLIPQDNLGVFIVCNSTSTLDTQFTRDFLNRYYPIQSKPNIANAKSLKSLSFLGGNYLDTITSKTTIEKLFEPYYFTVDIKDDKILVYDSRQYIQIEPMLFVSLEGDKYISFRENKQNHIIYLFDGIFSLHKMNWYEDFSFHIFLYIFFLSIFIFICVQNYLKLFLLSIHKKFNKYKLFRFVPEVRRESRLTVTLKRARMLTYLISYTNLIFLVVGKILMSCKESSCLKLIYGINPVYISLLCLPIISSGMTVILIFYICLIWRSKQGTSLQRYYYTLITGAALMFLLFLNYWNLLGFKF